MPPHPDPRSVDPDTIQLVTVKQYAKMMHIRPQSVYTAIETGRLPFPVIRACCDVIRIAVPRQEK